MTYGGPVPLPCGGDAGPPVLTLHLRKENVSMRVLVVEQKWKPELMFAAGGRLTGYTNRKRRAFAAKPELRPLLFVICGG